MHASILFRASSAVVGLAVVAALVGLITPAGAQSTTLHDQYDNQAQTTTNSQNFEEAFDEYDTEVADDFVVPSGTSSKIAKVEVAGQYQLEGTTMPTGVNVVLFEDEGGLPGTTVKRWLNVQPDGGFGSPNFSDLSIPLADAPALAPGHYWISVQVELVSGSHWFWRNRSVTTLNPAVYRNEDGGWGALVCSDWEPRASRCAPEGGLSTTDPDQVFRLLQAPPPLTHGRAISIRFDDAASRGDGLIIFGRLRLADGFVDCIAGVPVKLEFKKDGEWVTKKVTTTNRRGRYAVEVADNPGKWRGVAPKVEIYDEETGLLNLCLKAEKEKVHRHSV